MRSIKVCLVSDLITVCQVCTLGPTLYAFRMIQRLTLKGNPVFFIKIQFERMLYNYMFYYMTFEYRICFIIQCWLYHFMTFCCMMFRLSDVHTKEILITYCIQFSHSCTFSFASLNWGLVFTTLVMSKPDQSNSIFLFVLRRCIIPLSDFMNFNTPE